MSSLAGSSQVTELVEAFEKFQPGAAMVALTDHSPRELLAHLQANWKGLFEWSPLEAGPAVWRTRVTRRQAAPGARRRVHEALEWDHDRLDAILGLAFESRRTGDGPSARGLIAEFRLGLCRHIRFEEQELFPVFEARSGMPIHAGPTAVMRAEHREIEGLLEDLAGAMRLEGGAAEAVRDDLTRLLGWHNQKEEGVLYPLIDRCLGEDESDALIVRFQSS